MKKINSKTFYKRHSNELEKYIFDDKKTLHISSNKNDFIDVSNNYEFYFYEFSKDITQLDKKLKNNYDLIIITEAVGHGVDRVQEDPCGDHGEQVVLAVQYARGSQDVPRLCGEGGGANGLWAREEGAGARSVQAPRAVCRAHAARVQEREELQQAWERCARDGKDVAGEV